MQLRNNLRQNRIIKKIKKKKNNSYIYIVLFLLLIAIFTSISLYFYYNNNVKELNKTKKVENDKLDIKKVEKQKQIDILTTINNSSNNSSNNSDISNNDYSTADLKVIKPKIIDLEELRNYSSNIIIDYKKELNPQTGSIEVGKSCNDKKKDYDCVKRKCGQYNSDNYKCCPSEDAIEDPLYGSWCKELPNGSNCSFNGQCTSGWCSKGICKAKLKRGEKCPSTSDSDCKDSICAKRSEEDQTYICCHKNKSYVPGFWTTEVCNDD